MSSPTFLASLVETTLPREALLPMFDDIGFVRRAFAVCIIASMIHRPVHGILLSFEEYRRSREESATGGVAILHHAIEAIVLSTAMPFFTYCVIEISLAVAEHEDAASLVPEMEPRIISGCLLCVCLAAMYVYELVSRYDSFRPVEVLRRRVVIMNGLLCLFFPTSVMLKTYLALMYLVCFEAPLSVGLLLRGIAPTNKFTPKIMSGGILVFGATRPIQVLWVGAAALGSWNDPNAVRWQAILQFTSTILLTMLQCRSLMINRAVWSQRVDSVGANEDEWADTGDGRKKDADTADSMSDIPEVSLDVSEDADSKADRPRPPRRRLSHSKSSGECAVSRYPNTGEFDDIGEAIPPSADERRDESVTTGDIWTAEASSNGDGKGTISSFDEFMDILAVGGPPEAVDRPSSSPAASAAASHSARSTALFLGLLALSITALFVVIMTPPRGTAEGRLPPQKRSDSVSGLFP